ncbi:TetR/AcrR family transcriptional regulator [Patulibacter minatonensis]|uniref:TetR/AcrR family transcriptional regulator n=1 Tax=Patulibacter minatonensis TaxID=298163 RepID=UPI00047BB4F1|nr:TetR/AcrR family transcriptional regulator [Patulibacter minatonensis]
MSASASSPDPGERSRKNRARILAGLATALAEKGYAATTIADIAAAARVSRTTVYDHFSEKDQALIGLYSDLSDRLLTLLARELFGQDRTTPWRERLSLLMATYLGEMAAASAGERMSLLEIASAGPEGRLVRRDILDRFSVAIAWMSDVFSEIDPSARSLDPTLSLAVVGAINELVLRAAEDGPDAVRDLRAPTTEMIARLVQRPTEDAAG